VTTYVLVQHRPGEWVRARVDRQWRYAGRWRLSVFYYLGMEQFYRVHDAADCRPSKSG
jgi:hypothetical protein